MAEFSGGGGSDKRQIPSVSPKSGVIGRCLHGQRSIIRMSLSDVYRDRHYSPGYVYIAGSLDRVMKIGVTINIHQQQRRLRYLEYGSVSDWQLLYYVWVDEAGRIEHAARARLKNYRVVRRYTKDGVRQRGREIVDCSFNTAHEALLASIGEAERSKEWRSKYCGEYNSGYSKRSRLL